MRTVAPSSFGVNVGAELEMPHGETVIVRHVVSGAGDLAGVILAGTSPEFVKLG